MFCHFLSVHCFLCCIIYILRYFHFAMFCFVFIWNLKIHCQGQCEEVLSLCFLGRSWRFTLTVRSLHHCEMTLVWNQTGKSHSLQVDIGFPMTTCFFPTVWSWRACGRLGDMVGSQLSSICPPCVITTQTMEALQCITCNIFWVWDAEEVCIQSEDYVGKHGHFNNISLSIT